MAVYISKNMISGLSKIREEDLQRIFEAVNKFQKKFPDNDAEISFAYDKTYQELSDRSGGREFKGNGDPSIYIHETSKEKIFITSNKNKNNHCSIGTFLDKN